MKNIEKAKVKTKIIMRAAEMIAEGHTNLTRVKNEVAHQLAEQTGCSKADARQVTELTIAEFIEQNAS